MRLLVVRRKPCESSLRWGAREEHGAVTSGSGISEGRAVGINGDGWHFSGFRIPVCGRPPPHRAGVGRISGDGRAGIVGLSPSFGPSLHARTGLFSRSDGTLLMFGQDTSHARTGPLSRSDGTGLFLSPRPLPVPPWPPPGPFRRLFQGRELLLECGDLGFGIGLLGALVGDDLLGS